VKKLERPWYSERRLQGERQQRVGVEEDRAGRTAKSHSQKTLDAEVDRVEEGDVGDEVPVADRADEDEREEEVEGDDERALLAADARAAADVPLRREPVDDQAHDGGQGNASARDREPERRREDVAVGLSVLDAEDREGDSVDGDVDRQEDDGRDGEEALQAGREGSARD